MKRKNNAIGKSILDGECLHSILMSSGDSSVCGKPQVTMAILKNRMNDIMTQSVFRGVVFESAIFQTARASAEGSNPDFTGREWNNAVNIISGQSIPNCELFEFSIFQKKKALIFRSKPQIVL